MFLEAKPVIIGAPERRTRVPGRKTGRGACVAAARAVSEVRPQCVARIGRPWVWAAAATAKRLDRPGPVCQTSTFHPRTLFFMSEGPLNHPEAQAAAPAAATPTAPDGAAWGLVDAGNTAGDRVHAPAPAYQNLAQQMQVFLSRTDLQHGRKNKFFLQQTLELLAELDQHTAREMHLQTALQDTQGQIVRLKQKLVDMAADSVDAEQEALAIAQARAHLASLLHDKLVQEFK